MELNSYIAILAPPKHKKPPPSSGAIQLFFLASLLQCTSINRCALQLRAKKYFFLIKFLSPLLFKKYFLFLSFSLSGFSFFFLFPSHFFFSPSFTLYFADLFWIHLHRRPTSPSHAADPSRPILHLTANPSSIADLSFIVDPSSTSTAFIELKSAVDFVVGFRGCGWISLWQFGQISWWLWTVVLGWPWWWIGLWCFYCSEIDYFIVVDILFYCVER